MFFGPSNTFPATAVSGLAMPFAFLGLFPFKGELRSRRWSPRKNSFGCFFLRKDPTAEGESAGDPEVGANESSPDKAEDSVDGENDRSELSTLVSDSTV